MIKIDKKFMEKVYQHVESGYISRRQHEDYPELWIYNYTNVCACDKVWDDVTKTCRGLILKHKRWNSIDKNGFSLDVEVIARPFPKFFNYEEYINNGWKIPNTPYSMTNKIDGSLGIVFFYDERWQVATRGSFYSEQALVAENLLKECDLYYLNNVNTYLVEIIYPENRVVVNYGKSRGLFLLAGISNATGMDIRLDKESNSFKNIHNYGWFDMSVEDMIIRLKQRSTKNKEGVVLQYDNGLRIKIKFDEYIRLHRIMTGITDKRIWEGLRDGTPLSLDMAAVADFPDEIYQDTCNKENNLQREFENIKQEAFEHYDKGRIDSDFYGFHDSRKEIAEYFKKYKYPTILFCMLDKKDYGPFIWKLLKPKVEEPVEDNPCSI